MTSPQKVSTYQDHSNIPPELIGVTFRKLILEQTMYMSFLNENEIKVPYFHMINDQYFIFPVKPEYIPNTSQMFWNVWVVFDKDLNPVPTVGSTNGIFLHETGYIGLFRVDPDYSRMRGANGISVSEIIYLTRLDDLQLTKTSITKVRNDYKTTYGLMEDTDLANAFFNKYGTDLTKTFTMEVINGKLRHYFNS